MVKKAFLAVFVVLVAYSYLNFAGVFDIAKLKFEDRCFQIRYKTLYENNNDVSQGKIAIVTFDDETFQRVKDKWPWKRDLSALLINNISEAKPKLIASDIAFLGESDPALDTLLYNAIKDAGNVMLSAFVSEQGDYIKPFGPLAEASLGLGLTNKPRDKDFFIRRSRGVFLENKGQVVDYSLPIKVVSAYLGVGFDKIQYHKQNQKIVIPDEKKEIDINTINGVYKINFIGNTNNFIRIPVWKVVVGDFNPQLLKDKIVLIGTEAEIMRDIHNTSLGIMPGLVAIANEITMILERNFIKEIPQSFSYAFIVLLVLLMSVIIFYLGIWSGFFIIALEICLFWVMGYVLFLRGYIIDFFSLPILLIAVYIAINFSKYIQILFENIRLKELAIRDSLTNLYVRRYFQVRLEHEFERCLRYGVEISLLMIDLDHFKKINDTYGHQIGDRTLVEVSKVLMQACRKADIPVRYGGEEFAMILTNTSSTGAYACAEKIRNMIANIFIPKLKSKITASVGVATFEKHTREYLTNTEALIQAADKALYQAKNSGRNKAILAQPGSQE